VILSLEVLNDDDWVYVINPFTYFGEEMHQKICQGVQQVKLLTLYKIYLCVRMLEHKHQTSYIRYQGRDITLSQILNQLIFDQQPDKALTYFKYDFISNLIATLNQIIFSLMEDDQQINEILQDISEDDLYDVFSRNILTSPHVFIDVDD